MALVDIANNAGGKIGGFGDQADGSGQVTAKQLTANKTREARWINDKYPVVRKKIITDFAAMKAPFRESAKFADLGGDLKQHDVAVSSIASSGAVVTVTTDEVHRRSTGETVFLADILQKEGTYDIEGTLITSLNGTTPTITVIDTTSFTLDDVTGVDLTWLHEPDTGIVSYAPSMGAYTYAFKLPSDFFTLVRQTDTTYTESEGLRQEYKCRTILDRDGEGLILLTNDLTDKDGNSAYIEYCIDQQTFTLFSPGLEECIAVLLAAELCPNLGRDPETRQKLIAEYKALTVVEAKRNNQSQCNITAKIPTNYRGGRSQRIGGL